jgi:hypothetical protein
MSLEADELFPLPSGTRILEVGQHFFVDPSFRGGEHFSLLAFKRNGTWHYSHRQHTALSAELTKSTIEKNLFKVA